MAVVAFTAAALFVPSASAAVGDAFFDACGNAGAAQAPCSAAPGQTGAYREALSPDGKELYLLVSGGTPPGGSGTDSPAILIYDRDAATGKLTRRTNMGCVTKDGSSGACVQAANLDNPQDIAISPDGANVYVSNAGSDTIVEFTRATDGGLRLMSQCQGSAAGCTSAVGIGTPHALAISPDGKSVYLRSDGGPGAGTLLVFDRAADGTLTQKVSPDGCWAETAQTGCNVAAGISDQGWQIAATNSNVYATGRNDAYYYYTYSCFNYNGTSYCGYYTSAYVPSSGTVAIFSRAGDGSLSQAPEPNGCISNNGQSGGNSVFPGAAAPIRCTDGSDALDEARGVTLSPDGKSVYVGALKAVVAYSRGVDGSLTEAGCVEQIGAAEAGCTEAAGVGDTYRMALTPSGDELVASSNANSGFAFLNRDTTTGVLSERTGAKRCLTQSGSAGACETLAPLGGLGDVTISPDGRYYYLANQTNGVLATLHRDVAPSCQSSTVDVPYQTSILVPLTCTDVNGDTLTLSITKQPSQGFLGGGGSIDPATNSVRYSPPLAYSGADSFQFAATGQGVQSAPATVTLNIGSPPASSQPSGNSTPPATPISTPGTITAPTPSRLRSLRSKVTASWLVKKSRFTLRHLKLARLVRGWKVTVTCRGRHCPFKRKRIVNKKHRTGGFDAIKLLRRKTRFAAGQTVRITLTARGYRTKVVTYRLKKGKRPRAITTSRG